MYFNWENPCRIRHRIENIKSLDEEQIFDEPKRKRIQAEFENSTCIFKFRTELKKIKSWIVRTMRMNLSSMYPRDILSSSRGKKYPKLDVILLKESIKSSREYPFCHLWLRLPPFECGAIDKNCSETL